MRSILQFDPSVCYLCGGRATETHHVFGAALRSKSTKYGLVVRLCHNCHNERPNGVHHNKAVMDHLHREGQRAAMEHYGWTVEQFRDIFYKNYL
jgi:hypothetical protein